MRGEGGGEGRGGRRGGEGRGGEGESSLIANSELQNVYGYDIHITDSYIPVDTYTVQT